MVLRSATDSAESESFFESLTQSLHSTQPTLESKRMCKLYKGLSFHNPIFCLVAEPDKVLVGELNEWVANPLGPGQTSALQIKTRSA